MSLAGSRKDEAACICSFRAPAGTATCALCGGAMYPVGSNPFAKRQEVA
jgi:hypothetical protein